MKRLRLYFAVFSVLVAIPVAILLWRTYTSLEKEAFFLYRTVAEGVIATVSEQLLQNLQREEQRPFTHYRYIHVADSPVPKQEGLNISPLASFPVESEIPGVLGYFQVEPDGTFQTPLLPAANPNSALEVPQELARLELMGQLASIVEGRRNRVALEGLPEQELKQEGMDSKEATLSNLKKNLESSVDLSLNKEYAQRDSDEARLGELTETEDKAKDSSLFQLQSKVQKASPRQAEVFESQFADDVVEEADELRVSRVERPELGDEAYRIPGAKVRSVQRADLEFQEGAEVDRFVAYAIGTDWLVFERRVWWQDHRYTQGFVTRLGGFLEAFLRPQLKNSALPESTSYILFYRGEPILRERGIPSSRKPDLLYSSALPYPLSDFHLAITVDKLPEGPGYQTANWLSALLSILFVGGLFGIYRLTSTQIELSQKKSDFVSAVSHELKSPLTAIRMYGEILMEGWVEDEKREEYYRHIHDESERLSRLIQNVLTLAQLEKSEWHSDFTVVDPVEFVKEVVERLAAQAKHAGFELDVVTEGEPQPVQVDRDAVIQILINLIDNAIKFARDAESKKIVLTVSRVGSETSIRVRDFGPGIPRQKLRKIFEKFYRVEDEMTRTARGTGIGLALVKMLADSMGAQVDVRNRNPGAEFSICLLTTNGVSKVL